MSEELKYKLFSSTDCISEQTMFDYIDNKLSQKERHVVEKHLLDCDFCSDALEGLELVKDRSRIEAINSIIRKKIATTIPEKKVISINYKVVMSVAAGLLLLIGGLFFFNNFMGKASKEADMAELKSPPPPPAKEEPAPLQTETQPDSSPTVTSEVVTKSAEDVSAGVVSGTTTTVSKNENLSVADKEEQAPQVDRIAKLDETTLAKEQANKGAAAGDGNIADELKQTTSSPQYAKPDEDYKNIPQTSANQNAVVTVNDAAGKKRDEEKDKSKISFEGGAAGATSKSENTKSSGYYANETKEEKKSDKKEPSKDNRAETTHANTSSTVAYATDDVKSQMDQDQEKAVADSITILPGLAANGEMAFESTPQFPGGNDSLTKFIRKNFKYPTSNLEREKTQTKIIVKFTIDKNGNVKNPIVVKGINPSLDKEALRVVSLLPKWKPATTGGKAADYMYDLPINLDAK